MKQPIFLKIQTQRIFIKVLFIKSILFLAFFMFVESCTMPLARVGGYVKNPRLQQHQTIKRFSAKHNDPYDKLVVPKSKQDFAKILNRYPGFPTVLIYDKNFNVLENAQGEACHKRLINFFSDSLMFKYKKVYDTSYSFINEKVLVVDSTQNEEKYDYTIIYSWAIWTPRLSKDLFKRLDEIKKENKFKICFVSLNKDWQKGQYKKAPRLKDLGKE